MTYRVSSAHEEGGERVYSVSTKEFLGDEEGCTGCEVCMDCCPVDALDKVRSTEEADSSPTQVCRVDYETCVNCSLCAVLCPWETISMALNRGEAETLAAMQGTLAIGTGS